MQDSEMIEHSVARRRAHMAGALAELRSRMSMHHIAGAATRSATPALVGAAPMVARLAMKKPVGSALLSAGLGYLLFGHEPDLKTTARTLSAKVGEQGRSLGQASSGLLEKVQSVAVQTKDAVAHAGAVAEDKVRDLGRSLRPAPKAFRPATTLPPRNPRPVEMGALAFGAAFALGLVLMPRRTRQHASRQPAKLPLV